MSSSDVILTLQGGVRTIRLNRPKTKNAFNSTVYALVTNTLNHDANDDNVVVTIITGTGDYYSSGFDIKDAMGKFSDPESAAQNTEVRDLVQAFIEYPKLVIALINGPAIGIAVTTAALCDIVYASDKATFETPFIKIGVCCEGCSSFTFPQILGRSKASEVLLLGEKMTAQEAWNFGFVAKVVPHGDLGRFEQSLHRFGELSVNNVKINKRLITGHFKSNLCECNVKELAQLNECVQSEEFGAAMVKFMSRKSKL